MQCGLVGLWWMWRLFEWIGGETSDAKPNSFRWPKKYHQSAVPKTLQGIHPELDPFPLLLSSVCQIKYKIVQQAKEMSKKMEKYDAIARHAFKSKQRITPSWHTSPPT